MNKFAGQFALPQIYACIMWLEGLISLLEELISVVSVPLLSFGVSMTMIDFFVAGQLSKNPQFILSWSIIQAISIDAQIAYTWHKARRAWHQKKFLPFLGFLVVGLTLAFVVWGASSLEGLDHATGAGTLASFGLTPQILVGIRMAVAVILLCIAGWTRRLIAELDDISIEKPQTLIEKPMPILVLFGRWIQSIFSAILAVLTLKSFRDKRAQRMLELSAQHATTFVAEQEQTEAKVLSETSVQLPRRNTQKLPETLQVEAQQKPVQLSAQRNKNLYTKVEAAQQAKCSQKLIEDALKSGALTAAKKGGKITRSSLESFIEDRSKNKKKFSVVS
jgi:hypothetical protein